MTDLRAAAQRALEALEYLNVTAEHRVDDRIPDAAIVALRAALAQPEQEPVAWMVEFTSQNGGGQHLRFCEPRVRDRPLYKTITPLYTHPPRRESEQEPVALFTKYGPPTMRDRDFWSAGYAAGAARAIEQACKERNT